MGELDDLGVESGGAATDRFCVELEELAVAALLRPVVAKHRTEQIETRGLRALVEETFEVRSHHARGRFRPQGEVASATVIESVELLGDRVGVFADPLDQLGLLQDRGDDFLVAELSRHVLSSRLRGAPHRKVGGQDVTDSADGFDRLGAGH